MAEVTQYLFAHKEIVETLLKNLNIHEGHWAIAVEFQMAAITAGPTAETQLPSCVASVSKIGIQRSDVPLPNTIDASQANPGAAKKQKK